MFEYFKNPTKGKLEFEEVAEELINFILQDPKRVYRLIIGTDSEAKESPFFVTTIVILNKGKGGRFFWTKIRLKKKYSLRTRIYKETMLSLSLAMKVRETLEKRLSQIEAKNYNDLEIHTDIGQTGETKDIVREIVGMVKGSGFHVKIKPESFAASSIADRCLK